MTHCHEIAILDDRWRHAGISDGDFVELLYMIDKLIISQTPFRDEEVAASI